MTTNPAKQAARIVWTLRFLGYPNASMLDGGLAAWTGDGGEIESTAHQARTVNEPDVQPQTPQESWYLVESQLTARLSDPATIIVDIRTDAERADDVDQTISLGSIPGSIRLPWTSLLDANGQLLSPDALASTFSAAGIDTGKNVVLYGLFGTDTGLSWLAFRLAGYTTVAIYDGGWNEWARDPPPPNRRSDDHPIDLNSAHKPQCRKCPHHSGRKAHRRGPRLGTPFLYSVQPLPPIRRRSFTHLERSMYGTSTDGISRRHRWLTCLLMVTMLTGMLAGFARSAAASPAAGSDVNPELRALYPGLAQTSLTNENELAGLTTKLIKSGDDAGATMRQRPFIIGETAVQTTLGKGLPDQPSKFKPTIKPDATIDTEEGGRAALVAFLTLRGVDKKTIDGALKRYDDRATKRIIPAPRLRATVLMLSGWDPYESTISAILDGKNPTGSRLSAWSTIRFHRLGPRR